MHSYPTRIHLLTLCKSRLQPVETFYHTKKVNPKFYGPKNISCVRHVIKFFLNVMGRSQCLIKPL